MAGIAFKQPCPSCDHPVLIRDAALIGKKVLCPKCKYGFVVQKSAGTPALDDTPVAKPKPAKAPAKPAAPSPGALRDVNADEPEDNTAAKAASRKKRMVGLVLGGVGLIALALAAYVILGKPSTNLPNKNLPKPIIPSKDDTPDDDPKKKVPEVKNDKTEPKTTQPPVDEPVLVKAGPELTNLLPPDTEHVFHGFFKELFFGPLGEHVVGDRAINDGAIRPHIGFTIAEIDDIIRADRFTEKPWTFTVIHLGAIVDEKLVTAAFGLEARPLIRGHAYFKATKPNQRFDRLSHVAIGVPQWLRTIAVNDDRPLYVRFHNPQTLIFADEAPMRALLENNLQFRIHPENIENPPEVKDGKPVEGPLTKADLALLRTKPYLTIKAKLKDVLDRMEQKPEEDPDKPIYSTATEMDAARAPNQLVPPSDRGKFFWRGKQIWDVSNLLDERKPRIVVSGSSLLQRDMKNYQYRAELECDSEREARNVLKLADEIVAPELARNAERYLRLRIEVPRGDAPPKAADPKETSRWSAGLRDNSVDIRIDLAFDVATLSRVQNLLNLFALVTRSEVGLVADARGRHQLGEATVKLAEKGSVDRGVPAGSFPPGTFKLPAVRSSAPYDRLSWMTSLLPYLGHSNLSKRVDFNKSWRDPVNWMAARTIVPEFLDPTYPDASRYVMVPGIGVAPAATHLVGIVGVGLDAADYDRDDPALAAKRGVFGYDRSATLDELKKGRGASNVVMMMQIPYDGLTGVSPWIAGGGATLRGVPEKNSLAPFILSTDKTGKPITNNGKRGTYAIMADGSVRWLDESMSDDVIKALCTVAGPAPQADFFKEAPLIADPGAKKAAAPPKAAPPRAETKVEVAPLPEKTKGVEEKKK